MNSENLNKNTKEKRVLDSVEISKRKENTILQN